MLLENKQLPGYLSRSFFPEEQILVDPAGCEERRF
jgi:hypothetical protein